MVLQPAFLSFVPIDLVDLLTFLTGFSAVAELLFIFIKGVSSEESSEATTGEDINSILSKVTICKVENILLPLAVLLTVCVIC